MADKEDDTKLRAKAKAIERILRPGDGWWKRDTGDTVTTAALAMLEAGMPKGATEDTLSIVISAMMGEYGE